MLVGATSTSAPAPRRPADEEGTRRKPRIVDPEGPPTSAGGRRTPTTPGPGVGAGPGDGALTAGRATGSTPHDDQTVGRSTQAGAAHHPTYEAPSPTAEGPPPATTHATGPGAGSIVDDQTIARDGRSTPTPSPDPIADGADADAASSTRPKLPAVALGMAAAILAVVVIAGLVLSSGGRGAPSKAPDETRPPTSTSTPRPGGLSRVSIQPPEQVTVSAAADGTWQLRWLRPADVPDDERITYLVYQVLTGDETLLAEVTDVQADIPGEDVVTDRLTNVCFFIQATAMGTTSTSGDACAPLPDAPEPAP